MRAEPRKRRFVSSLVVLAALGAALVGCRNPGPGTGGPSAPNTPIIFVHGFYGSGDQYRSMALYFASNGWPAERIRTVSYNSIGANTVARDIDDEIASLKRQFNVQKVHLVGHSMGTMVLSSYMGSAARQANVDKVVLVDGAGCTTIPNCLAIRAATMRSAGTTQNQTHVESTVSPESFARQYQFFTGRAPATTNVVPEQGPIKVAVRVLEFKQNTPQANLPVKVWEVNEATGARVGGAPAATARTKADGWIDPVTVPGQRTYEFEVDRQGTTFHAYFQKFLRTDLGLHINTIGPNTTQARNSYESPQAAVATVVRNKEFWRSHGAANDTMTITTTTNDGRTQRPVEAFQNVRSDVAGVWIQDNAATPGQSSLQTLTAFADAFQTGVDVFMPGANPPNGTISFVNSHRGNSRQTINTANWNSVNDAVLVEFNDWG